jgi:hypothetical protein
MENTTQFGRANEWEGNNAYLSDNQVLILFVVLCCVINSFRLMNHCVLRTVFRLRNNTLTTVQTLESLSTYLFDRQGVTPVCRFVLWYTSFSTGTTTPYTNNTTL